MLAISFYINHHVQTSNRGAIKMLIRFDNFNSRRHMRGADAAQFLISYGDADDELVWMSKKDIEENIKQFPEHEEELRKGFKHY